MIRLQSDGKPLILDMVVPARDQTCSVAFAPELDFGGTFIRRATGGGDEARRGLGGDVEGAAGEDQVVGEGEGGHEGLGDEGAVEVDVGGVGGGAFFAVRELRGLSGGRCVEFVDVGGNVGGVVDFWEADARAGVRVLVVGVLVHVEELGGGPVVAGVG